jgi:hypothetical protein
MSNPIVPEALAINRGLHYDGKRLEILKRIQRDKDQFVQDVVDLVGQLIMKNQEDMKALDEIVEAEKATAIPTD